MHPTVFSVLLMHHMHKERTKTGDVITVVLPTRKMVFFLFFTGEILWFLKVLFLFCSPALCPIYFSVGQWIQSFFGPDWSSNVFRDISC